MKRLKQLWKTTTADDIRAKEVRLERAEDHLTSVIVPRKTKRLEDLKLAIALASDEPTPENKNALAEARKLHREAEQDEKDQRLDIEAMRESLEQARIRYTQEKEDSVWREEAKRGQECISLANEVDEHLKIACQKAFEAIRLGTELHRRAPRVESGLKGSPISEDVFTYAFRRALFRNGMTWAAGTWPSSAREPSFVDVVRNGVQWVLKYRTDPMQADGRDADAVT